ncbi:hypothetical protein AB0J83_14680 [Actinoplanes sp. NPDC049596]|uniref:hypothetical protein n=1 Tax=unclassified Actinoplanes TaxID=2626549 RepID=UPI0034432523
MAVTVYITLGSLAVAAAGLLFTILDKRKDRHRRVIVEVREVPLLPAIAGPRIGLTLDGVLLDTPRLYVVRATNVGRAGLPRQDIEKPLTVTVDGGRLHLLTASFHDHPSSPPEPLKGVAANKEGLEIQAPKTLLNPGNTLQLLFITVGTAAAPQVSLRAKDFKVAH